MKMSFKRAFGFIKVALIFYTTMITAYAITLNIEVERLHMVLNYTTRVPVAKPVCIDVAKPVCIDVAKPVCIDVTKSIMLERLNANPNNLEVLKVNEETK